VTANRDEIFSSLRTIRDEQASDDEGNIQIDVWAVRTRNQLAAVYEAMRRDKSRDERAAWEQLAATAIARIESIDNSTPEDTPETTSVPSTEEAQP